MSDDGWNLRKTDFGIATINTLRILWEKNQPKENPDKSVIMLQAGRWFIINLNEFWKHLLSGDPTVFGNFPPYPKIIEALKEALDIDKFSYDSSAGLEVARQAVAEYSHHMGEITADDIILTSGCSMAIEISFRALANPGENILIPRPSWNYSTWLCGSGIEAQFYDLDPLNDWQIDLKHLESLINVKTRGILINSPGNPCGNVFSKEHMLEILEIAERHKLPIISDEVYEFFVFPNVQYHSISSLSKNVPVFTCSGLTKRFLIPAIRYLRVNFSHTFSTTWKNDFQHGLAGYQWSWWQIEGRSIRVEEHSRQKLRSQLNRSIGFAKDFEMCSPGILWGYATKSWSEWSTRSIF